MAVGVGTLSIALLWAVRPLAERWREEAQDRRVVVAVDWNEFQDFNARLAATDVVLLNELRDRGVNALAISPITLGDLVQQHRVQPLGPSLGLDALNVARLKVQDPLLARQLVTQWAWRNVPGLELRQEGNSAVISRRQGGFTALKDSDAGYDPVLLSHVRAAGLLPVFRIFNDPWLSPAQFPEWLQALPNDFRQKAVLFSSDELPGGLPSIPLWRSWLVQNEVLQFLPEFHPAASAWQMAHALPAYTFRAHSIPAAELKDLKPDQQLARWHRAVEERSCRLLLVRLGPADTKESFLSGVSALTDLLKRHEWRLSAPVPRTTWPEITRWQRWASPLVAFGIVCLAPLVALRWAWVSTGGSSAERWRRSFLRVAVGSLIGALLAAAIAQSPYTRLEIFPFRGVKWAFILSWSFSGFVLYRWDELRAKLSQHIRRWDVLVGGMAAIAIAYLVLRSGNAPAAWKPSWEQSVRDLLETWLIARPRFKEFAIGFPALWTGFYVQSLYRLRRTNWDGRPLIWAGMIGPISMINTFCHLHSPLKLELWRSLNGLVLGILLGILAIQGLRKSRLLQRAAPLPARREEDLMVFPRG